MDNSLISRQAAIDAVNNAFDRETLLTGFVRSIAVRAIMDIPSAQPEYEPVTAEDLAKTMSVTTAYSFMAWYGTALSLMERQGFVICKKTM